MIKFVIIVFNWSSLGGKGNKKGGVLLYSGMYKGQERQNDVWDKCTLVLPLDKALDVQQKV